MLVGLHAPARRRGAPRTRVNRTQPTHTHSTTGECLTNHRVFSRQGRLMLIPPQRDDQTAAALSLSALL